MRSVRFIAIVVGVVDFFGGRKEFPRLSEYSAQVLMRRGFLLALSMNHTSDSVSISTVLEYALEYAC